MIEVLEKLLLVIVGGVLVWLGTYISDRRKQRESQNELLRRAYSNWFAAEAFFTQRCKALVSLFREKSSTIAELELILSEVRAVQEEMKPLLAAVHEIFLLEQREFKRKIILNQNKLLLRNFNELNEIFVGFRRIRTLKSSLEEKPQDKERGEMLIELKQLEQEGVSMVKRLEALIEAAHDVVVDIQTSVAKRE